MVRGRCCLSVSTVQERHSRENKKTKAQRQIVSNPCGPEEGRPKIFHIEISFQVLEPNPWAQVIQEPTAMLTRPSRGSTGHCEGSVLVSLFWWWFDSTTAVSCSVYGMRCCFSTVDSFCSLSERSPLPAPTHFAKFSCATQQPLPMCVSLSTASL